MTVTEYSIETHDHPHITRRQKLKLHAANGVAITCYCLHEQHKHSAQADDALNRVSGSHCSLRTPTSARLLIDKTSSWTRLTLIKVVEDVAFGAHWPCQSIGRGLCAKVRAGGSPRASREPLVASADEPSVGSVAREKNRVPFRTVYCVRSSQFPASPPRAGPAAAAWHYQTHTTLSSILLVLWVHFA